MVPTSTSAALGWAVMFTAASVLAQQSLFPVKRVQPWFTTMPNHPYFLGVLCQS